MKNIRNKLIFKAFQAKEAAREKALMLKQERWTPPARVTLTPPSRSSLPLLSAVCLWLDWLRSSTT